jgi:sugar-specific transcriptional regulator TrmB
MTIKKLKVVAEAHSSLSSQMQNQGFTDYEARIYIQLLRISPATAYEISKAAGVPRSNAYSALVSLTRHGAVQPVSEEPVRYIATAPQALLERIARTTSDLCTELATDLAELHSVEETSHSVWTAWGDDAVHERVERLIRDAKRCLWFKAADKVLRRHAEAIRAAAERKLEILIVLFGDDPDEFRYSDTVRVYPHEGDGVRTIAADNLFTMTVDHEEALAANGHGDLFASYTRNRSIVTMAEALIRHDVYVAEIFTHIGPGFRERFEPQFEALRSSCFPPDLYEELKRRARQ